MRTFRFRLVFQSEILGLLMFPSSHAEELRHWESLCRQARLIFWLFCFVTVRILHRSMEEFHPYSPCWIGWWNMKRASRIRISSYHVSKSCYWHFLTSSFLTKYRMQFRTEVYQSHFTFHFQPLLFEARKEMFLRKYSKLFEQKIIPPERAFGVTDLKHLCRFVVKIRRKERKSCCSIFRCAIREELRRNFQLPEGIKLLKIPRALKRYVDLLQDWNCPNKSGDIKLSYCMQ